MGNNNSAYNQQASDNFNSITSQSSAATSSNIKRNIICSIFIVFIVILLFIITPPLFGPKCQDKDKKKRCIPNGSYGSGTDKSNFLDSSCDKGNQVCPSGSCHELTYQPNCSPEQQKCVNGIFICDGDII